MADSLGAAPLMLTVAVLIAAGFIVLWVRDRGRADAVSDDPALARTWSHLGPDAREGAAEPSPESTTDRRH